MHQFLRNLDKRLLLIIIIACLAIIGISIFGGLYIQSSGDDFQLIRLSDSGPVNYFSVFLSKLNGRFTYALVCFFLYQAPGIFVHLTPVLFYSGLLLGSFLLFRKFIIGASPYLLTALSTFFVFTVAMLSPEKYQISYYQTIYWLPSYLAYGLPLALLLFLFAYFYGVSNGNQSKKNLALLLVFSFIIGGLHELIAVVGLIFLACFVILQIVEHRLQNNHLPPWKKIVQLITPLLATFIGFVSAVTINYLLPATAFRRNISISEHESKKEIFVLSWHFTIKLFQTTLNNPLLLFCLLGALMTSLIIFQSPSVKKLRPLHPLTIYLSLFLTLTVPFLILFMTALMSQFGQAQDPPERVYLPFYFSLSLSITLFAILLAILISKLSKSAIQATLLSAGIVLLVLLIPIILDYSAKTLIFDTALKQEGASARGRDKIIREQVSRGVKTVHIQFFMTLGDTPYPKHDKDYWFNYELARYYKVDYVIAD